MCGAWPSKCSDLRLLLSNSDDFVLAYGSHKWWADKRYEPL
jgi:hypothetical protein